MNETPEVDVYEYELCTGSETQTGPTPNMLRFSSAMQNLPPVVIF